MILYKLTNENDQTCAETQWGEGIEHTASGKGDLCGPGWLHAYTDRLLAVLLDPINARFGETAHLWQAEGDVGKSDRGLQVGCTRLRTIRRIKKPVVSTVQRVAFGILCAREGCDDPSWRDWAEKWLDGRDRSINSAAEAWAAASAWAAVEAMRAGSAARAWAWAPARTAAEASAWAAVEAARAEKSLDLRALAIKAMEVKP